MIYIVLLVFSLAAVAFVYKAWVLPIWVKLGHSPHELGRDSEVSAREMRRRSVWRYDSWTDRIMSILLLALVIAFWLVTTLH